MPQTSPSPETPPIAVEFHRGGRPESVHRAYVCVVDSDGLLHYSLGNPKYSTFLRSSTKPLQAMSAVLLGAADHFKLTERELAIISGSHGGEQIHTDTVSGILAKIGLEVSALHCGVQQPLDRNAATLLAEKNYRPTPLHHNCSGKHSGMLAGAIYKHLTTEDYLDPNHPIQKGIINTLSIMCSAPAKQIGIGIDGCSAPVHAIPMYNAALAYARLVKPTGIPSEYETAANRICNAMRAYPEMVAAAKERLCTQLIRAGSAVSMIAKAGAEGYYAAAWIDPISHKGMGLSVKIEDGSQRARDPLVLAVLKKFGALPDPLPDNLQPFASDKITNFAHLTVGDIVVRV